MRRSVLARSFWTWRSPAFHSAAPPSLPRTRRASAKPREPGTPGVRTGAWGAWGARPGPGHLTAGGGPGDGQGEGGGHGGIDGVAALPERVASDVGAGRRHGDDEAVPGLLRRLFVRGGAEQQRHGEQQREQDEAGRTAGPHGGGLL